MVFVTVQSFLCVKAHKFVMSVIELVSQSASQEANANQLEKLEAAKAA